MAKNISEHFSKINFDEESKKLIKRWSKKVSYRLSREGTDSQSNGIPKEFPETPSHKLQRQLSNPLSQRFVTVENGHATYSRLDEIPDGKASNQIVEGCLVLEGGGFRGIYTQGALDALMQNDVNLSTVVGVSAGALAGISYVSGQIGRSARANLTYRHNPEYLGLKAYLMSGSPVNLDFLLKNFEAIEPTNLHRFDQNRQELVAVATNCLTGETSYFKKSETEEFLNAVKASASLPLISPMVEVNGVPHLDGGCSCKIPFKWALEQGFEKIVVIRTRDFSYRKEIKDPPQFTHQFYKNYPEFQAKLLSNNRDYNQECDDLEAIEKEGRVFVLTPSQKITVGQLESDVEKLGDLYWLGYQDALNQMDQIKDYLGIVSQDVWDW